MIVLIWVPFVGMRQDASQVRILYVHVRFWPWHHGCLGQSLTQLRGQLKFFEIRGLAIVLILIRIMLILVVITMVVLVVAVVVAVVVTIMVCVLVMAGVVEMMLPLLGNMVRMYVVHLLRCCAVTRVGTIEGTSIHPICTRGWVVHVLVGRTLIFGRHDRGDFVPRSGILTSTSRALKACSYGMRLDGKISRRSHARANTSYWTCT